jgi:hypothetical protein
MSFESFWFEGSRLTVHPYDRTPSVTGQILQNVEHRRYHMNDMNSSDRSIMDEDEDQCPECGHTWPHDRQLHFRECDYYQESNQLCLDGHESQSDEAERLVVMGSAHCQ